MSNAHYFMKPGFLRVPLQNGIGRYVNQLQRITYKFCKSSGSSRGIRSFIEHDIINLAQQQPGIVIYTKPRRHRMPVIVAEFLNGDRQWMSVDNMSREEIVRWTNVLIGSWNDGSVRFRKPWYTDYPSIQGPWNPFNSYPNRKPEFEPSAAYVKLLEMAKEQGIQVDESTIEH